MCFLLVIATYLLPKTLYNYAVGLFHSLPTTIRVFSRPPYHMVSLLKYLAPTLLSFHHSSCKFLVISVSTKMILPTFRDLRWASSPPMILSSTSSQSHAHPLGHVITKNLHNTHFKHPTLHLPAPTFPSHSLQNMDVNSLTPPGPLIHVPSSLHYSPFSVHPYNNPLA